MAKQVSSLSVGLFATVAPFAEGMRAGERAASSFVDKVTGIGSALLGFGAVTAVAGTAVGALFDIGKGFRLAADMEQANVALTTMTGSAATAASVMKDLAAFGAATPFQLPELVAASKQLIAFGEPVPNLMRDLTNLGDVASGVGVPIGSVAEVFGRVMVAGKLTGESLRRLQEAGIPVTAALGAQFHTTQAAVGSLVESGQVGFGQFKAAMESLTGPGGQFSGMMAKQSQTVAGLMSTLADTVDMTLANVATTAIESFNLRGGIRALTAGLDVAGAAVGGWVEAAAPVLRSFGVAAFSAFSRMYDAVAPVVRSVATAIVSAWGPVSSFVSAHAAQIETVIAAVGGALAATSIPAILGAIGTAAGFVGAVLSPVLVPLAGLASVAGVAGAALGVLAMRFDLVGTASRAIGAAAAYVSANWGGMVQATLSAGLAIVDLVSGAFTGVLNIVTGVWSGVTGIVGWAWSAITGRSASGGEAVGTVFGGLVTAGKWFTSGLLAAFDVVGYGFAHLGEVASLAGTEVSLGLVRAANWVTYAFGTEVPTVISWFANNAGDIFRTFSDYSVQVMANLAGNVYEIFRHLPGLIAGTTNWAEVWTPLSMGFESSIRELPQIPKRVQGELERSLSEQADALKGSLGKGMSDAIAQRRKDAEDAARQITGGLADAFGAKPPAIPKPEVPKPDPVKVDAALNPSNLALSITPEMKLAKVMRAGSAEALSLRFARVPAATIPAPSMANAATAAPPPSVQPAAAAPPVAALAGPAGRGGTADRATAELARWDTEYLEKIERNTRQSSLTVIDFT